MAPFYKALVGSLLRSGLGLLTTYLVRHHVLTTDLASQATERLTSDALLYGPAAIAAVWSVWHKWRVYQQTAAPTPPTMKV